MNTPLLRPAWMTGDASNDWPEDAPHENGGYFNECAVCKTNFIGHKHRWVCRKCSTEEKARWESLSDAEKKADTEKLFADLDAWLSTPPTP